MLKGRMVDGDLNYAVQMLLVEQWHFGDVKTK
jgi:hypothetical protein